MAFDRDSVQLLYKKLVALYPQGFKEQFAESMLKRTGLEQKRTLRVMNLIVGAGVNVAGIGDCVAGSVEVGKKEG